MAMSTTERPGLIQLMPAAARGELCVLGSGHCWPRGACKSGASCEAAGLGRERLASGRVHGRARRRIAAGSVGLVAFGIDSLIEVAAAGVAIWPFSGGRGSSRTAERRAQQMIAATYALLIAYISVEAVRDLLGGHTRR
jgi:hypothetical protein